MTQVLYGERMGRQGLLAVGCTAAILNQAGQVLLTKRNDNGLWCLPGGMMNPGESVEEACLREVCEETGLRVHLKRLVGVYSDPNQLVIYDDGSRFQFVAIHFEAEVIEGVPGLSNETIDVGWFWPDDLERLEILGNHKRRIEDTLLRQAQAVFR